MKVFFERKDKKQEFDALAEELTALGLAEDLDFYIVGRVPMPAPSSEHIGIDFTEGEFEVWYRDMGTSRTLLKTAEFAEARRRFVEDSLRLAAGRGRGPEAKKS